MTRIVGRLSLGLSRPLWEWVHAEAQRQGVAVSELIRRVLDERRESAREQ